MLSSHWLFVREVSFCNSLTASIRLPARVVGYSFFTPTQNNKERSLGEGATSQDNSPGDLSGANTPATIRLTVAQRIRGRANTG
jgi:hypothetical protein